METKHPTWKDGIGVAAALLVAGATLARTTGLLERSDPIADRPATTITPTTPGDGAPGAPRADDVRVWKFAYRTHRGVTRSAYVALPSWYGPRDNPDLPVVISPHGRGADGRSNAEFFDTLPAVGRFAVISPDGMGRKLKRFSYGYAGHIDDLARMPDLAVQALPWLRIDRDRVFALGSSMGGQETLLLVARHPRLLAGAAALDSVTDLSRRYRQLPELPCNERCRERWGEPYGSVLQAAMRRELGGDPLANRRAYAARSGLSQAARIAASGVPLQLWWSTQDRIVHDQEHQSEALFEELRRLDPCAPVSAYVGRWAHSTEMRASALLPIALDGFGLLPAEAKALPSTVRYTPAATCSRRLASRSAESLSAAERRTGYGWPVRPFDVQHPIRGSFGDPRIGMTPNGRRHSFHFGVDVSAPNGTPVYATMDGVAVRWAHRPETVGVRGSDGRTEFQYWHIAPAVAAGTHVRAYRTVLGRIEAPWAHVHFAELRDGVYLNPLRSGALRPYGDDGVPTIKSLCTVRDGSVVRGTRVAGVLDLVAEAVDETPIAVPAPWTGKPVTPALLRWRLVSPRRRLAGPWRTAADFRVRIPDDSQFFAVYAPWTRQNLASRNGRYRFYLARGWDSRLVPDGEYLVVVSATDSRGNSSTRRFPLRIANASRGGLVLPAGELVA
jgi:hypothetical protein